MCSHAKPLHQARFGIASRAAALVAGDLNLLKWEVTEPRRLAIWQWDLVRHCIACQTMPAVEARAVMISSAISSISQRMITLALVVFILQQHVSLLRNADPDRTRLFPDQRLHKLPS